MAVAVSMLSSSAVCTAAWQSRMAASSARWAARDSVELVSSLFCRSTTYTPQLHGSRMWLSSGLSSRNASRRL